MSGLDMLVVPHVALADQDLTTVQGAEIASASQVAAGDVAPTRAVVALLRPPGEVPREVASKCEQDEQIRRGENGQGE